MDMLRQPLGSTYSHSSPALVTLSHSIDTHGESLSLLLDPRSDPSFSLSLSSTSGRSVTHLCSTTHLLPHLTGLRAPDRNLCLIYAQLCCTATCLFMLFMWKLPTRHYSFGTELFLLLKPEVQDCTKLKTPVAVV